MNRQGLKAAVRSLLAEVNGIGKVAAFLGQGPDERSKARPEWPYWEVTIASSVESYQTMPRGVRELPTIAIEGWFPFDATGASESRWDDLIEAVKAKLREHRTLLGASGESDLPEDSANDLRSYSTSGEVVDCHHVLILLGVRDVFTYDRAD